MDPAGADPFQELMEKLTQLKAGWPAPAWSWDARFGTVASSFPKDAEAQARASAVIALPYAWSSTTIATAPGGLRAIADRTGGLRAGQMLMAGKASGVVLFGLWWPWGGGATITLRIGVGEHAADEEPVPQLRAVFGVTV